jgi:hypothetical protein
MRKLWRRQPRRYKILDITTEVIRDYHHSVSPLAEPQFEVDYESLLAESPNNAQQHPVDYVYNNTIPFGPILQPTTEGLDLPPDGLVPAIVSPISTRHSENAAADLLYLSRAAKPEASVDQSMSLESISMDLMTDCFNFDDFTPDSGFEDGVFLPGSSYHELHTTLRDHLIQEVQSSEPTRCVTPEASQHGFDTTSEDRSTREASRKPTSAGETNPLSKDEELYLWRNWLAEVAPWLDKFDSQCHFQLTLPTMAATNPHLY